MPELPEVETVVRELNKKLKGLTIKSVQVLAPKIVSVGPQTVSNIRQASQQSANKFVSMLLGQKIVSVTRRSKLLIFDFSGPLAMMVHLKMTGQFIFEDKALRKKTGGKYRLLNKAHIPLTQLPAKHTHVIFQFTNGSTLYYNDVRKFGYLKVVKDEEISLVKELNSYGPEPLENKFTEAVFLDRVQKIKNRKTTIKQMIMDNSFVVGIGNIYSDEILFHAKVNPNRKVSSIKEAEWKSIFAQIKPVLKKGIEAKGSSVGDFVRTDGSWGTMGKYHYVYGRKGKECLICKTKILNSKLGGRTASYCPSCQK